MISKIIAVCETKEDAKLELNKYALVVLKKSDTLFDQYMDDKEMFFNEHLIPEEKRMINISNLVLFEEYFMEYLLRSPRLIRNVRDAGYEKFGIANIP